MDASASTSEVEGSLPRANTLGLDVVEPNALAVEYMSDPSSSSISMMRSAFKGLLDTHDESPLPISADHEDFETS